MSRVAHVLDGAVIEIRPHRAAGAQPAGLLEYLELVGETLLNLIPLGITIRSFRVSSRLGPLFGDIHHVSDPCSDGFDQDLGPFLFEESKHIEVSVTFCSLCPELSGDLNHRLHAQAVDFNGVDAVATDMQCVDIFFAV